MVCNYDKRIFKAFVSNLASKLSDFKPQNLLAQVSEMRQNLALDFERVFDFVGNLKKGNILVSGGFLTLFSVFSGLGNESRVAKKKNKRKTGYIFYLFLFLAVLNSTNKHKKRKFQQIRKLLLNTLKKEKELTLNEIATKSGVSWKTAKLHLIYLKGKNLVEETLSTPYVRIFKIKEKN